MRIAIIRPECSNNRGGAERYCMMLCKGLCQAGHNVFFIGNRMDQELAGIAEFIPVHYAKGPSAFRNYAFHTEAQKALKLLPKVITYSLSRTFPVDIYRLTDPLHIHHISLHYSTPIKRLWTRLSLRHSLLLGLERKTLQQSYGCRFAVAISRLDKKLLKKYYSIEEDRVRVIYNGVDMKKFNPGCKILRKPLRKRLKLSGTQTVYLFPAMDFKRKGLITLLKAVSLLKHPFTLLIAGKGDEKSFIRMATGLKISDRVRFLGRWTNMNELYGISDIMVLPTKYDPFGNVHLEALACGLPVITTSQAGGAEVVKHEDTGFILQDSGDFKTLARFLENFEAQKNQWDQWHRRAANSVKEFTIEANIRQNLELMELVAKEKGIKI